METSVWHIWTVRRSVCKPHLRMCAWEGTLAALKPAPWYALPIPAKGPCMDLWFVHSVFKHSSHLASRCLQHPSVKQPCWASCVFVRRFGPVLSEFVFDGVKWPDRLTKDSLRHIAFMLPEFSPGHARSVKIRRNWRLRWQGPSQLAPLLERSSTCKADRRPCQRYLGLADF